MRNKAIKTSLLRTLILLICFMLFNSLSIAQKTEVKAKKKLYISTIKANGVPVTTASRVKEGIRLAVFEGYGARYQVLDDDAIKVMYKQAEAIMASGCSDTSCITQIAEGINADEIVYGEISHDGTKIAISITGLERKGVSLSTKSIVKLAFFESQLDYAASEAAKKIMDPTYKIDMNKAPVVQDAKIGGIEIKTVKGLDISVIQFKSEDETAGKIVEFSKSIIAEGDEYFNKKKYSNAREKYLDIIDRVRTTLSADKQAKVKGYIEGVYKRIDSTYVMDFKPEIEKTDAWLKAIKEPEESNLEKGLEKYGSIEQEINKIQDPYKSSRTQLLNAINDRKDSIHIALLSGYEKKGDILYRDYKFSEAMDLYKKAYTRTERIKNVENKYDASVRILKKIDAASKTGQGFLANRVKSLVDQAEYYNFQRNTSGAKNVMAEASNLINGPMIIFTTIPALETFNNYADVMKINKLSVKTNPFFAKEELTRIEEAEAYRLATIEEMKQQKTYTKEMRKKGYFVVKEMGGIKFVKVPVGSFMMGSPNGEGNGDEDPKHRVTVDGFWIGMNEITQRQYQDIMGNNPSIDQSDTLPVDGVNWNDAMNFCKKFSKKYSVNARLPYEAEWEYACRAGTITRYYWGEEMDGNYCWYADNSQEKTHPVGEKKPNAWGLFDMSGNVREWCMDWYNATYYEDSPKKNPKGPNSGSNRVFSGSDNKIPYYQVLTIPNNGSDHVFSGGDRVVRGGSWRSSGHSNRSADRAYINPDNNGDVDIGFRLVVSEP